MASCNVASEAWMASRNVASEVPVSSRSAFVSLRNSLPMACMSDRRSRTS